MFCSTPLRTVCLCLTLAALPACRRSEELTRKADESPWQAAVQDESPGALAIDTLPVEYHEQEVQAAFLRTVERQKEYRDYTSLQLHTLMSELSPRRSAGSIHSLDSRRPGIGRIDQARKRQLESQDYQMRLRQPGRRGTRVAPPNSLVTRILPLLCAAADARDRRAASEAIRLAMSLTQRLQEPEFGAPKLAICEQHGEVNLFLPRSYSSPYLKFRLWLYRLKRQGAVSSLIGDMAADILFQNSGASEQSKFRVSGSLTNAAAGELFQYVGNYDLALAFYWTALEELEQDLAGGRRVWLVLDESQRLSVLLMPQGTSSPLISSLTEEVPGSTIVRCVRAGQAEKWNEAVDSIPKTVPRSPRAAADVECDLQRSLVLVGMADCLLSRGHRQWASQLAEAAIRACDTPDTRVVQDRMLSQGGESGFPSDFYTVPARALRILGEADLEFLLRVAAPDFPATSKLNRHHRRIARRAKKRLTEAYQLYIDGGRWAETLNTAFELVRLEILELTDGGANAQTFAELKQMLSPKVMLSEQPKQWCQEVELPEGYPLDIDRLLDLRFLEKRGTLAVTLSCLAGDKEAATAESEYTANSWRRIRARAGGESFSFSLAHSHNRRHEPLIRGLVSVGLYEEALKWSERVRHRALLDIIAQGRTEENDLNTRRAQEVFEFASQRFSDLQKVFKVAATTDLRIPGSMRMQGSEFVDVPVLDDFLASIPKQTAVIDYYLFDETGIAWVLSREGVQAVPLAVGKRQCRELVRRWRQELGTETTRGVGGVVSVPRGTEIDPRTDKVSRALYDRLVAPIDRHAAPFRNWCIVPHGPLKYLSFAALSDGKTLCLNQHAISYLWSLNSWPRLVALGRTKKLNRIACLGNPDTGDPNESLPGTEIEVRNVARLFAQSSVDIGRDASFFQLAVAARDADVLHLACHSLPVDAYGNRALILAATDRHSGRVSYDSLYRLQTPAFLASLSCCSTGLGQEMAGDEFLGFSRGFLAAGVPSLMISLWDVPDESTAMLTTEFYRQLRKHDLATALQIAQQKTAASYPSPWHWAAFTVYGVWDPAVAKK